MEASKRAIYQNQGQAGKPETNDEIEGRGEADNPNGRRNDGEDIDDGLANGPRVEEEAESADLESDSEEESGDDGKQDEAAFSVVYQGCFQDRLVSRSLQRSTRLFREVRRAEATDK